MKRLPDGQTTARSKKRKLSVEPGPSNGEANTNSDDAPTSSDFFVRHFNWHVSKSDLKAVFNENRPSNSAQIKLDSFKQYNAVYAPAVQNVTEFLQNDLQITEFLDQICLHQNLTDWATEKKWSDEQRNLARVVFSYVDLYYCRSSPVNMDQLRSLYCLHAMNHARRSRATVLAHNAAIKELAEQSSKSEHKNDTLLADEIDDSMRDRGLVRPKVLILVPFRNSAQKIVNNLIEMNFGKGNKPTVTHRKRFKREFGSTDQTESLRPDLPADYKKTFEGNIDDCFRIGISVAKKAVKLYVDFFEADILVASPLGLRTVVGTPGEPHFNPDFLSSIEILIIDQTDILLMQNWMHLLHIFEHMHSVPKQLRQETDVGRVRLWALEELSKFYRQTLVFSSCAAPEFRALFSNFCRNHTGMVAVSPDIPKLGVVPTVSARVTHTLRRFSVSAENCSDGGASARFDYFTRQILPDFVGADKAHTLLFIPSYFDFVRIRNHCKKEQISVALCCEYSSNKKVAKGRDMFFHGDKYMLAMTERFHFYKRYFIRGVHRVLFYQLPITPNFYSEICNMAAACDTFKEPIVHVDVLYWLGI